MAVVDNIDSKIQYLPIRSMSFLEFSQSLELLGLSDLQAAQRFGLSLRQIQHYKAGFRTSHCVKIPTPVPTPLTLLIRLMIKRDISPIELK